MNDLGDVETFLENQNKPMEPTAQRLYHHWKAQEEGRYEKDDETLGRVLVLGEPATASKAGAQVYDALGKVLEDEPPIEDIIVSDPLVYAPQTRSKVKRKDAKKFLRDEIHDIEFPDLDDEEVTDAMRVQKYTQQQYEKITEGIKNATESGYRKARFHFVLGDHFRNQLRDFVETKVQEYKTGMEEIQEELERKAEAKEEKQGELSNLIDNLNTFLDDLENDRENEDEYDYSIEDLAENVANIHQLSEEVEELADHYRKEEINLQEMERQLEQYTLTEINNTYLVSSDEEKELNEAAVAELLEDYHNLGNVKNIIISEEGDNIEIKGKDFHLVHNNHYTSTPLKSGFQKFLDGYEDDADIAIEFHHGPHKKLAKKTERGSSENTIFMEAATLQNPKGLENARAEGVTSPQDAKRYKKYGGELFSSAATIIEWDRNGQPRFRELDLNYLLDLQEAIERGDEETIDEYLAAKNPSKPFEDGENPGEWFDVIGDIHVGSQHDPRLWHHPTNVAMADAAMQWIEEHGYADNLILTGDIIDGTQTYPGHGHSADNIQMTDLSRLQEEVNVFAGALPEEEQEDFKDYAHQYIAQWVAHASGLKNEDAQYEEVKGRYIPAWAEMRDTGTEVFIASGDHVGKSRRHRDSEESLGIRTMFPRPPSGESHKEGITAFTGESSGAGFAETGDGTDIFVSHSVSGTQDPAHRAATHFDDLAQEYFRLHFSGDDHRWATAQRWVGGEDGRSVKFWRNPGLQVATSLLARIGMLDSPRGFHRGYDDEEHGYSEEYPVLDEQLVPDAVEAQIQPQTG